MPGANQSLFLASLFLGLIFLVGFLSKRQSTKSRTRKNPFLGIASAVLLATLSIALIQNKIFWTLPSPPSSGSFSFEATRSLLRGAGSESLLEAREQGLWRSDRAGEQVFRSDGIHIYPTGGLCKDRVGVVRNFSSEEGFSIRACSISSGGDGTRFFLSVDGYLLSELLYLPPFSCGTFGFPHPVNASIGFFPFPEGNCDNEDVVLLSLAKESSGYQNKLHEAGSRGLDPELAQFLLLNSSLACASGLLLNDGGATISPCSCSTSTISFENFDRGPLLVCQEGSGKTSLKTPQTSQELEEGTCSLVDASLGITISSIANESSCGNQSTRISLRGV